MVLISKIDQIQQFFESTNEIDLHPEFVGFGHLGDMGVGGLRSSFTLLEVLLQA
jgi:hypothetical protein